MLFSFLHKNKSKSFAVFAIDTGSITLTILEKTEKNTRITYVRKLSIESDHISTSSDLLRSVVSKFDKIFGEILKQKAFESLKRSTEITVLVGSPWHIGWSDKLSIVKDRPFTVTHKLIDSSVKDYFIKEHKDLSITNVNVMSYRLNGYDIHNPINKVTKSLDLRMYIGSADSVFVDTLVRKIKSYLPYNKISFLPQSNIINVSLSSMFPSKDYLIVVPENKTTEIILVKGGMIKNEASIPFGSETLASDLFGAKSSGIKESLSKVKRFVRGEIDVPDLDSVNQSIMIAKDKFLNSFRDIVWKMNDSLLLPSDIYIIGENVASHFILDWINKEEYCKKTYTVDGFRVVGISGNDLLGNSKGFNNSNYKKNIPFSVAVSYKVVDNINI